jgi:hypothetical protein
MLLIASHALATRCRAVLPSSSISDSLLRFPFSLVIVFTLFSGGVYRIVCDMQRSRLDFLSQLLYRSVHQGTSTFRRVSEHLRSSEPFLKDPANPIPFSRF